MVHETATHIVTYHQQDTADWCGAAVAQMVLNSIGVDLLNLNQDGLFTSNNPPDVAESDWSSPPDGLARTMQKVAPPNLRNLFDVVRLPTEEAISRKICWSIHRHGIAPIALVFGHEHWIVVTGYTADRAPTISTDTLYNIESFDIHNPFPPSPSNPFPHSNGDNCGTGGDRGISNENVIYQDAAGNPGPWKTTYMTGVSFGFWGGEQRFIAICDGDPAADTQATSIEFEGEPVRDTHEIISRARVGREPRIASLDTDPADLILVELEGVANPQFYYIVPFRDQDGTAPFVAQVGAHQEGAFAGSISAPEGTTHIAPKLHRDAVIDRFIGLSVSVGGNRVVLRREDLNEHLVWFPCRESLSPYWPFYRFDVGGPASATKVYVRIDGLLVPEPHHGRGM